MKGANPKTNRTNLPLVVSSLFHMRLSLSLSLFVFHGEDPQKRKSWNAFVGNVDSHFHLSPFSILLLIWQVYQLICAMWENKTVHQAQIVLSISFTSG